MLIEECGVDLSSVLAGSVDRVFSDRRLDKAC